MQIYVVMSVHLSGHKKKPVTFLRDYVSKILQTLYDENYVPLGFHHQTSFQLS